MFKQKEERNKIKLQRNKIERDITGEEEKIRIRREEWKGEKS